MLKLKMFLLYRLMSCLLLVSPAFVLSAAEVSEQTKVVILGVNHTTQLVTQTQRPAVLRAFFERVKPDAMAIERDPQALSRNSFYDFTYEVQDIVLPWAAEQKVPYHAIDWVPPAEDARLMFGIDLDAAPFIRPVRGFGGFLVFEDKALLSLPLFYADDPASWQQTLNWAESFPAHTGADAARRLFLYRTYMQARRVAKVAEQYKGGTVLVVVGHMHKPDIERILASDPTIKLVNPTDYGMPTEQQIASQEITADHLAVATFNLLGLQAQSDVIDLDYLTAVIAQLSTAQPDSTEVALFKIRLKILKGQLAPLQAIAAYQAIQPKLNADDTFSWTGVTEKHRLDSFFDPFGNLTIAQRIRLEIAREQAKLGNTEQVTAEKQQLETELSATKAAQLAIYWPRYIGETR